MVDVHCRRAAHLKIAIVGLAAVLLIAIGGIFL
jgi:hypothetical protein